MGPILKSKAVRKECQGHVRMLNVCGFVHHSKIHKENPTRCNCVSKFYSSIFIWSSTCFGRHTAHHREPKTALAASGFSYVRGCWTCRWWTLSGNAWQRSPSARPTTPHVWKTIGCQCSFRLPMMGGVSPETCWASYKYRRIKFWHIVASCWIFFMKCTYAFTQRMVWAMNGSQRTWCHSIGLLELVHSLTLEDGTDRLSWNVGNNCKSTLHKIPQQPRSCVTVLIQNNMQSPWT